MAIDRDAAVDRTELGEGAWVDVVRGWVTGADELDAAAVEQARRVLDRAQERSGIAGDHTVVALAGATGSGIDFGAFVSFEILKFMDIAAGVDYIRYGFDFNNIPDTAGTPGDLTSQKIAGGATDTFLSGWAGVVFHLDPSTEVDAESGAVSVEAKTPPSDVEEEEEEE